MNRPLKASEVKIDQQMPRLEDVSEEYAKLQAKKTELLSESQRLQGLLLEPVEVEDKSRVAQLLGDIPPVDENKRRERAEARAETETKLNDISEALSILDRRMGDERLKASDEICRRIEPIYKALVRDLCLRLLATNEANASLHKFMSDLNTQGISWSQLQPMGCRFLGMPNNPDNVIMGYVRMALQAGFLSATDVPALVTGQDLPYQTKPKLAIARATPDADAPVDPSNRNRAPGGDESLINPADRQS